MNNSRYFLAVIGFLLCLQDVLGQYTLNVLLSKFDDGQGFLADGTHCNNFWFEGKQCNIQLKIRVNFPGSDNDTWVDLGQVTSNANSIIFNQTTYGAWANPTSYPQDGQYAGFSLSVQAFEATNGKSIDEFTTPFYGAGQINDVGYYSHPRLDDLLEPTLITFAWFVQGNVSSPPPTGEPITTTLTPSIPPGSMDCEMAYDIYKYEESQVITISLTNGKTAKVYCEYDKRTKTVQTVFQSRGSTDADQYLFEDQTYDDYIKEFGMAGIDHNYWMGLDNLNAFTTGRSKRYNMTIIACCGDEMKVFQTYSNVTVSDGNSGYIINGQSQSSTGLSYNTIKKDFGQKFTIATNWTGSFPQEFCPMFYYNGKANQAGGWWFGNCADNLNGHYYSFDELGDNCEVNDGNITEYGTGIELYNGENLQSGIPKISYTRVRMAFYRADGKGISQNSNFCTAEPTPDSSPTTPNPGATTPVNGENTGNTQQPVTDITVSAGPTGETPNGPDSSNPTIPSGDTTDGPDSSNPTIPSGDTTDGPDSSNPTIPSGDTTDGPGSSNPTISGDETTEFPGGSTTSN